MTRPRSEVVCAANLFKFDKQLLDSPWHLHGRQEPRDLAIVRQVASGELAKQDLADLERLECGDGGGDGG